MKIIQALLCASFVLGIAGCGGGGGKGKSSQAAPVAAVTMAFTTPAIATEVILGDDNKIQVAGTWTGTNLGSNQVHLQIADSAGTFTMPATQQASGGQFSYVLPLASSVGSGQRNGTLTIRACKDAQCAQPYANASATLSYQLQVHEPAVTVIVAGGPIVDTIDLGDDIYSTLVGGTWSATHLGTNKVYLQVSDNAGAFSTPEPQLSSPGAFNYKLPLVPGLPVAPRSGLLTVRACKDALCTKPYANAMVSIAYQLQFMRIDEWETHQRNAAHDGYVPITLDPSKFAKVWEWQRPAGTEPIGGINAVATSDGSVYVSTDVYFGEGRLYSLNEGTGQARWSVTFGTVPGMIHRPTTTDASTWLPRGTRTRSCGRSTPPTARSNSRRRLRGNGRTSSHRRSTARRSIPMAATSAEPYMRTTAWLAPPCGWAAPAATTTCRRRRSTRPMPITTQAPRW